VCPKEKSPPRSGRRRKSTLTVVMRRGPHQRESMQRRHAQTDTGVVIIDKSILRTAVEPIAASSTTPAAIRTAGQKTAKSVPRKPVKIVETQQGLPRQSEESAQWGALGKSIERVDKVSPACSALAVR